MTVASSPRATLETFMRHTQGLKKMSPLPIRAVSQEDRTRTPDSEAVGCCYSGRPELLETTRSQPLYVGLNSQNHSSACLLGWGKCTEENNTRIKGTWDCVACGKGGWGNGQLTSQARGAVQTPLWNHGLECLPGRIRARRAMGVTGEAGCQDALRDTWLSNLLLFIKPSKC